MTPTQRYIWAEAYLIGVKKGVLIRNVSLSGLTVPDEAWWSSSEPVSRYYRSLTPGYLRDRIDKMYAVAEFRVVPIEDGLDCVIPEREEGLSASLCLLLPGIAEGQRKEAAEAAKRR